MRVLDPTFAACPPLPALSPLVWPSSPTGHPALGPLIMEEDCGLRPGHLSLHTVDQFWIFNLYRRSRMGLQSSWGSASVALNLLEEALAGEKPEKAKEYKI
ncbi:hypothetical protein F5141DRAFT_1216916 [Pisolithus sp. B1]|nr:hypothetical protein F5141DRAFT_1216916 [Pisolithus sp. B1]